MRYLPGESKALSQDCYPLRSARAVVARYFHNHLERALIIARECGYVTPARCLSALRFNRQLHRYADFLGLCL